MNGRSYITLVKIILSNTIFIFCKSSSGSLIRSVLLQIVLPYVYNQYFVSDINKIKC